MGFEQIDIFLILFIICVILGFFRFINLIYVSKKGFRSKLEYIKYSHSFETTDHNTHLPTGIEYVKVKYRTKSGLFFKTTVNKKFFKKSVWDSVDIIVFPNNPKKFIYVKKMSQWIWPVISTILLFISIITYITAGY